MDLIREFSEETSIHGVFYIFEKFQSGVGKLIWITVVTFMLFLGSYWSIQAYSEWVNNPVLTTVLTTAYPVKKVDFPAVTICGQGMNEDVFSSGIMKPFLGYLYSKQLLTIPNVTPLLLAQLLFVKVNADQNKNGQVVLSNISSYNG
jgi:hypothetical protein